VAVAADTSLHQRLDAYFASDPLAIADPFPLLGDLRRAGAVYEHGPTVLVSTHAACKEAMRDDTALSSTSGRTGTRVDAIRARLTDEQRAAFDELAELEGMFVVSLDGDEHARARAIMHRAFTPRKIAELELATQRYVDAMLAPLVEQGGGDLKELAYRLPLMIICDLLGVPESDRELIHEWSSIIGRNRSGADPDPRPMMAAHATWREFRGYVGELIADHRRATRRSDLVAALMDAEGERMSAEELTVSFVVLLFAGHETTTNLIGNGFLELLRNRPQWELLADDPGLAPQATEELLRVVTPVQWTNRVAVADCELAGTRIERGQTVLLMLAAANRDPFVFADPEQLDLTRPDARNHLSLGFARHFCLGASLARLEGTIAFGTLARRFPGVELDVDPAGLAWRGNAKLRGVARLPVTLGPERPAA
jgi:cytochrome P450